MILEETYTLSNGVEIPKLGLGTWFIDNANALPTRRTATSSVCRACRGRHVQPSGTW